MLEILIAAAATAAIDSQPGLDRQNPLSFVSGQVAGALRIEGDHYICVTSINGRSGQRGDQAMCTVLTEASARRVLRRAGANAEYWGVQSLRVDGTSASEQEDFGSLVFSSSARITVRSDGSIGTCVPISRPVVNPTPGFEYAPDVCTLYPPGQERIFAADPARTRTVGAQLSLGFYLRRP